MCCGSDHEGGTVLGFDGVGRWNDTGLGEKDIDSCLIGTVCS